MLRRLCTLLLVLACVLAPALTALETIAKSDDCGCGGSCCDTRDCAMPPVPTRASTTPHVVVGAVEARATVARTAPRAATFRLLSFFEKMPVQPARVSFALRVVDAVASAPLYQVHCTFLI